MPGTTLAKDGMTHILLVCRSPAASPAQQDAAHVQAAVNAVQMG